MGKLAGYNKFWIALVGALGTFLSNYFGLPLENVLPGLTAVAVLLIPNRG